MTKPVMILDPDWRQMDELFSPATLAALHDKFAVVWGQDGPIPGDVYKAALPEAAVLISASPQVSVATLAAAPKLRTIIEVSGAFPDTIDYEACFAAGVELLSCAPGFRQSVAEMGLAMALSGGRGLVREHEAFRSDSEHWLADCPESDFTLYGGTVGFVGFGQIAQEITRLMAPFKAKITAYDPWLPVAVAADYGITLVSLDAVLSQPKCVFVTASPTAENHHLLNGARLALIQSQALLIVLSRAHLVDFEALDAELAAGRIKACIDVFPAEPVPAEAPLRQRKGVILSPHRAAAVDKGRQLIGDMILADLTAIAAGTPARMLARADQATISLLAGVGDAKSVADMAKER